jgi:hypothetical protein
LKQRLKTHSGGFGFLEDTILSGLNFDRSLVCGRYRLQEKTFAKRKIWPDATIGGKKCVLLPGNVCGIR